MFLVLCATAYNMDIPESNLGNAFCLVNTSSKPGAFHFTSSSLAHELSVCYSLLAFKEVKSLSMAAAMVNLNFRR